MNAVIVLFFDKRKEAPRSMKLGNHQFENFQFQEYCQPELVEGVLRS